MRRKKIDDYRLLYIAWYQAHNMEGGGVPPFFPKGWCNEKFAPPDCSDNLFGIILIFSWKIEILPFKVFLNLLSSCILLLYCEGGKPQIRLTTNYVTTHHYFFPPHLFFVGHCLQSFWITSIYCIRILSQHFMLFIMV